MFIAKYLKNAIRKIYNYMNVIHIIISFNIISFNSHLI